MNTVQMHSILRRLFGYAKHKARTVASSGLVRVAWLAGEDGPGGIRFDDFDTAFLVANLALAVILLDGGLRTRARSFRVALAPSLTLATLGVVVTAALLGAFVVAITGLDWRYGLLLGAIVGSTDAAAVFSLMRQSGIRLNERVTSTLEIESGANDPMAIFLVLVMVEWILSGEAKGGAALLSDFAQQFGLGGLGGVAGGFLLASLLARVQLAEGLYALLIVSGGLLLFSLVNALGGSGFLAVYLAGLVIGNRPTHATEHVLRVMDGLAWLSQAGMFLVLGLLVNFTQVFAATGLTARHAYQLASNSFEACFASEADKRHWQHQLKEAFERFVEHD